MAIKFINKRISVFKFEEPQNEYEFNQIEIKEEVSANIISPDNNEKAKVIITVCLDGVFKKGEDSPNITLKTVYEYDADKNEELNKETLAPCALETINFSRKTLSELTGVMFSNPINLPLLTELQ